MEKNTHYYSKTQENVKSNPNIYTFNFHDYTFRFHTDSGVFSKEYIDYGTFAMLKAFIPNDIDGDILDMGAGYGPIGIVLSTLYKKHAVMCEIKERAYNLNLENIEDNKADCVVFNSNLYEAVEGMEFASILTNPPIRAGKQTVFAIYDGAYTLLKQNGELWVVIQKKQGAPSSKEHLEELFGNCEIITRDKGYYILKSIKK
jgi:16S rRNA (guanine1207-N2)-methyltransferase